MKIVCFCNNVLEKDVREVSKKFPKAPPEAIKKYLKIGERCGCCECPDCPSIEIHLSKVLGSIDLKDHESV